MSRLKKIVFGSGIAGIGSAFSYVQQKDDILKLQNEVDKLNCRRFSDSTSKYFCGNYSYPHECYEYENDCLRQQSCLQTKLKTIKLCPFPIYWIIKNIHPTFPKVCDSEF